jgi:hypothetical protein
MRATALLLSVLALGVQVCAHPAEAQTSSSQPGDVPAQADRLLKQMSAYIGSANEFTFHADITFDHVTTVEFPHQAPQLWPGFDDFQDGGD